MIKSRKAILYCFLFFASVFLAQNNKQYATGKVNYSITTFFDKNSSRHKSVLKSFPDAVPKIKSVANEFDFSLYFNDSISLFYLERKLFSDKLAAILTTIHVGYFGRIKQNTKKYITEELQESFGKFRVIRDYQKWKMHDETKQIGQYLCFKATTFTTITNPKGKVFRRDFTAWYTPELPYKFGPAGYGNLPGLIIELQGDGFTYGVKKIEFFKEKNKENLIPKLKRKRLIIEEEFEKLAAEDEKKWRNKRNKN